MKSPARGKRTKHSWPNTFHTQLYARHLAKNIIQKTKITAIFYYKTINFANN